MTSPREIWTFATEYVGQRVQVYDSLPSTSDVAGQLATDPEHYGTVVLTEFQTAGRGQYGRVWQSQPRSSMLISIVIQPPPSIRRPVILTAWAAVGISRAIQELSGLNPRIKWPNDLLIQGKKVCGILIEQSTAVVCGIGLNLNQSAEVFANAHLPDATSLHIETGREYELRHVVGTVIRLLDAEYTRLVAGDRHALECEWAQRTGLVGRTVAVEMTDGTILPGRLRELSLDALELDIGEVVPRVLQPELVRHIRQL